MKNMHICNIVLTGHWQSDGRKALAYQPNWTNSKFLDTPKIIQLMNHLIEPWSSSKISFSNFLNLSRICLNNKTTYTNKVVYSTVPWADHPRKTMAGVEQVNFPSKALLRKSHTAKLWQEVRTWVPSKRFSQMFVPQRWRVKECKSNPWPFFGMCFVECLMW